MWRFEIALINKGSAPIPSRYCKSNKSGNVCTNALCAFSLMLADRKKRHLLVFTTYLNSYNNKAKIKCTYGVFLWCSIFNVLGFMTEPKSLSNTLSN